MCGSTVVEEETLVVRCGGLARKESKIKKQTLSGGSFETLKREKLLMLILWGTPKRGGSPF